MSIVGSAHNTWQFWDGRKDSLWSQALEPLENPIEHAGSRNYYAHFIYSNLSYKNQYEQLP